MRKWICLLLAAALLLGLLGTASAEDWFDCHCAEEKFSTKIPFPISPLPPARRQLLSSRVL